MDCPVCSSPMVTMELAQVEIDHCLDCGGIWLDRGELEAFASGAEGADDLASRMQPADRGQEKAHKCPLCDRPMDKVQMELGARRLVLDRCPQGEGLWFDKGELLEVLKGAGVGQDSQVMGLLVSMFGLGL